MFSKYTFTYRTFMLNINEENKK
uniref:Uncharacterized protein n=1 Tax=Heterorhabditis bacteriophora TaxID=37862 RepID=A0A1I7X083_HETBA